jgi:hypothetical protein
MPKERRSIQLMAELDAIKELRPTGGLMLRRDGSSMP